jgi:integrase
MSNSRFDQIGQAEGLKLLIKQEIRGMLQEMVTEKKALTVLAKRKRKQRPNKSRWDVSPRPTGSRLVFPPEYEEFNATDPTSEDYALIGPVILAYIEAFQHRRPTTRYQYESTINDFLTTLRLHENLPIQMIDRQACQRWKASLLNQTSGRKRKAISTQGKLKAFSHFTRWLVAQDYHGFTQDPMRGLLLPARAVSDSKTRKEAFTDAELAIIVKALAPFREHDQANKREFYWLMLALMVTGARMSEILDIKTVDIRPVDDIPCFDIKPGEGRAIKTKSSHRKVPIHSQFIGLGFLDWLATSQSLTTSISTPQVFPLLSTFGVPSVSRWGTELLKACGVKRPEISTHSLRHSMTVNLERAKVHPSVMAKILGHALVGRGVEGTTYLQSLSYPVKELAEAIETISFPMPVFRHREDTAAHCGGDQENL